MDQHEAAVALAGDVAAMIQVRREGRGGEGERVDEMDARRAAPLLGLFFLLFLGDGLADAALRTLIMLVLDTGAEIRRALTA